MPSDPPRPAPDLPPASDGVLPWPLVAAVLEGTADALVVFDRELRYRYVNARAGALFGCDPASLVGRRYLDAYPEAAGSPFHEAYARALRTGCPETLRATYGPWGRQFENRVYPTADGVAVLFTEIVDPPSRVVPGVSQSRYLHAVLDAAPDGVVVVARDGTVLDVNPAALGVFGAPDAAAVRGRSVLDVALPRGAGTLARAAEETFAGGRGRFEVDVRTPDGARRVEARTAPLRGPAGEVLAALAVVRDVTDQRGAAERVRESEAQFQAVLDAVDALVWTWDARTDRTWWRGPLLERLGYPAEVVPPPGTADRFGWWFERVHPDDRSGYRERTAQWREHAVASGQLAYRFRRADGTYATLRSVVRVQRDAAGEPTRVVGLELDVSAPAEAERALAESEERFRQLAENLGGIVWLAELGATLADSRLLYVSPAYARVMGEPPGEHGRVPMLALDRVAAEDRPALLEAGRAVVGGERQAVVCRLATPGRGVRVLHTSLYPIRDGAGRVFRIGGITEDVTEQHGLEERLRQAERLEALGQLAGGVAHDFNNLLTVINASTTFARGALPAESPVQDDLVEIERAAARAAALTRQLLAFSRKQRAQPRHVRLGELVRGAETMLHRVIGEEIVLEVAIAAPAAVVVADPGQLEQVLVNLAVNARDAMLTPLHGHPGTGGTLVFEVDEVALDASAARAWTGVGAGRWVRLRVRDTGHGMDATTQAHIFEPFFTTKEVGRGTGLGLATVFGIVRQAGGALRVDSAPGAGATFSILLPRADAHAPADAPTAAADAAGDGATVLLVEDEGAVRSAARRMLERRGHTVLEARHGMDALLLWREHRATIDAVVTDVRMPELGGRELVAHLHADRPTLPVVFVSGYTDRAGGAGLAAGARVAFVEKPFTADALLAALDRALGAAWGDA